jgi:hypothetical protein
MAFPVRDGKTTYRAFLFGGVGLNFSGVEQTQLYLQSIDRLSRMKDIQEILPTIHSKGESLNGTLLKQRKDGELNPYVDPKAFQVWLIELRNAAEKKLETEKAKAP